MDVKGANLDQVKAQMQQRGIVPEDWGGETITVPVSAIKGTGVNDLLEMILLQADVLELKANPKAEASGVVIESQVDVGRGPLSTVIVQKGTLRTGDAIVCGAHWAKVRAMFDDQGRPIKEAGPSTPVRVIGWSGTPDGGAVFRAAKNAREAENLAEEEAHRLKKAVTTVDSAQKDISVEHLFANIAATQQKVLKVIVKADVFGSAEAVKQLLEGIKSTKVSLEIVSTDVGLVTKNDVIMAAAAGATIVGFSTKLENGVTPLAKHNARPHRDLRHHLRTRRQGAGDDGRPPRSGHKGDQARGRRGARDLPARQGLRRRLPRHRGQGEPQCRGATAPGPRDRPRGQGRHAQALQGRRQRGARRASSAASSSTTSTATRWAT